jgi:ribose 5-phosphate isomerase A
MKNDTIAAKRAAGSAAAKMIQSGMLVGLGTGSTADFFIESLIERCKNEDLDITAFPSSNKSAEMAIAGGIPLCNERLITTLDITVDGADEIDPQKRMIKGGGGALLREKIIASMSKEMIIVVDQTKLVDQLGGFPLPVEVVPFAHHATMWKVQNLGYHGIFRRTANGQLFVTDNGNYIIDITFPGRCASPEKDQAILSSISGIIETGFFLGMAGRVVVGQFDGSVSII